MTLTHLLLNRAEMQSDKRISWFAVLCGFNNRALPTSQRTRNITAIVTHLG